MISTFRYGLDASKAKDKEENILVFDLGGGTFDASLLNVDGGVFEVRTEYNYDLRREGTNVMYFMTVNTANVPFCLVDKSGKSDGGRHTLGRGGL